MEGGALRKNQRLSLNLSLQNANTTAPAPYRQAESVIPARRAGAGQQEGDSPQVAGLRGEALGREGQPHWTDCCLGAERHSDTQAAQQNPTPETPANWEQGNGAQDRGGGSEGAPPFRSHPPRPPAHGRHGMSICENQQLDEQRNTPECTSPWEVDRSRGARAAAIQEGSM